MSDKLNVENLVYFDLSTDIEDDNMDLQQLRNKGYNLVRFSELIDDDADFEELEQNLPIVSAQNISTISYTSGTTGEPKGVMLSHNNIVSGLGAFEYQDFYATSEDRHLSYLPMAHVLERLFFYGMMGVGGQIGVFNGDINKL